MIARETVTLANGAEWTCGELTVSDVRALMAGEIEEAEQPKDHASIAVLYLYLRDDKDIDFQTLAKIYDVELSDMDVLVDADIDLLAKTARRLNRRFFAMRRHLIEAAQNEVQKES